jgi:DNA-binding GntR family transcriptional regulator
MFKTKQDYVYELLCEAILSGRFKPGEHLVLEDLAEEFGTSRTPLREAIRRLQTEGLVDFAPHRGAVVAELSVEELIELYHIRAVLDGLAARLATNSLSGEDLTKLQDIFEKTRRELDPSNPVRFDEFNRTFHEIIYRASNAPFLYEMIISLYTQTGRYRHLSLRSAGRIQEVLDEHHRILDALVDRDAEMAERFAREHHENTAKVLVDLLEKGPEWERGEEQQISLVENVAD